MNPIVKDLASLFVRELQRLRDELDAYSDEANMWTTSGDSKNSPGHLALHLCGNLQHFIGAVIGQSGYVRNRPLEFESDPIPRAVLHQLITTTTEVVEQTFNDFDGTRLTEPYPIEVFGQSMSHHYFLTHLNGHLNYHLGQINYHRRITA